MRILASSCFPKIRIHACLRGCGYSLLRVSQKSESHFFNVKFFQRPIFSTSYFYRQIFQTSNFFIKFFYRFFKLQIFQQILLLLNNLFSTLGFRNFQKKMFSGRFPANILDRQIGGPPATVWRRYGDAPLLPSVERRQRHAAAGRDHGGTCRAKTR